MIKKENGAKLEGNERFEGYCKDLADLIGITMLNHVSNFLT